MAKLASPHTHEEVRDSSERGKNWRGAKEDGYI
jgi:hypothetical protein